MEAGPVLFVRYAFPPNQHGYCGPSDSASFFEYGATGTVDPGLRIHAQQFAGAWPYLQLIAASTGIADPLDRRVVEAYWVGNALLDRVGVSALGGSMEERFRFRAGPRFTSLSEGFLAGGVPHHSFHVFCIYPWVGLLGDDRRATHALTVLDKCRIRWGRVRGLHGAHVTVESSPLTWDGRRLELGPPETETALRARDGVSLLDGLAVGDWVSLHWEWVCDRLSARQLARLRGYTRRHLAIVNDRVDHSGPAAVLG
ncbi:MAG: DUF6390 family protein [Actinomycetota bacterium]|nr:DUF6390 family protein [Actinomycetota bacterium]